MSRPRRGSAEPTESSGKGERGGLGAQLADALAARLLESTAAEAFVEQVLRALIRSPALQDFTSQLLGELQVSSALDALVDRQVERVLRELQASETLSKLVQDVVTNYLAYLELHPEGLRRVVQLQSRGAVQEFLDGLRERARATDDALDSVARRVLGKT